MKAKEMNLKVEIGKRLECVTGQPKQVFLKVGKQRIGSVLFWGDVPGKEIRLNDAGKFWLHDLLTK